VISAVSGGTFPAAYYGLFGDRIFEDFEKKFLNRNIQRALLFQALRPWNLFRLLTPNFTRSMMASNYYDRKVFDRATFADLAKSPGPHIHINATDLSHGHRFTFSQGQFDVICSDLDVLPVATAVAASSAVPVLLTPVTLKNFAGTCGFEMPELIREALEMRRTNRRRYEAALSFADFVDAENRKYIHLVDGGISDNLGLRFSIELAAAAGGAESVRQLLDIDVPDHFVLMVVNAETDPDPSIDLSVTSPSLASTMTSISGSQIRRYNLETLLLVEDSLTEWAAAFSKGSGHKVEPYLIEVSFDDISDEGDRDYYKLLPTSFVLGDDQIDDLRRAGRRLLRENPTFQKLLEGLK
jgi:NTE family protein